MYQERDRNINLINTRKNNLVYGGGLGIMLLDDIYPGFPGDVRNPSAYPFPIQYDIVENIDIKMLVYDEDKSPCREPILKAAKRLERLGCRAIAAECGYFAYFQKDVVNEVSIPVFMSSLLQVPLMQQIIPPNKKVGIFCYEGHCMTDEHLVNAGITPGGRYIVGGAADQYGCEEFANLWNYRVRADKPLAYYDKAEKEIVAGVTAFVEDNPDIGGILLECTGMQPFGRAVQRKVEMPLCDWGTLLDYAYAIVNHRDYYGHV